MPRDDAYLLDMLVAARKILQFTRSATRDQFDLDELLQNTVIRMLEIIGEAARNISEDTRAAHSDIPWRQIIGMRHRLVHEYFRIDLERVWDTVQKDIPELIRLVEPLVPPEHA
jgi:uncharacterized protein with HEPN domain